MSENKARDPVTWAVKRLTNPGLQHLSSRAQLKRGGNKAELQKRVGKAYAGDFERMLSTLRNSDLAKLARMRADELSFQLFGLSKGRSAELESLLRVLVVDGWTPPAGGEQPVPGTPFTAIGSEDEDEDDGTLLGRGNERSFDDAGAERQPARGSLLGDDDGSALSRIDDAFSEAGVGDEEGDDPDETTAFPAFECIEIATAPGPEHRADATLADFQREAVRALDEHFRTHETGLLCLPTGGGKTCQRAAKLTVLGAAKLIPRSRRTGWPRSGRTR